MSDSLKERLFLIKRNFFKYKDNSNIMYPLNHVFAEDLNYAILNKIKSAHYLHILFYNITKSILVGIDFNSFTELETLILDNQIKLIFNKMEKHLNLNAFW